MDSMSTRKMEYAINIDENDDDYFSDDSCVQDVFMTPVAEQTWGKMRVSFYFKPVREVAPHLTTWRFNRKVNQEHKNALKMALRENPHPHFMGTIQVIRDKKGNCRIMNGQHRIIASLEVLEEDLDMNFNMNLMFEVYDVPYENLNDFTLQNDDVDELFKIANTSLAMMPEDEHDNFCKQLVIAMGNDKVLKKGVVDKSTGAVRRPRILVKDMYEYLKECLPTNHGLSTDEIIQRMKHINVKLSLMDNKTLFGRASPAQTKMEQRRKAHDVGFFLNLDCKYTPREWIPWIVHLTACT